MIGASVFSDGSGAKKAVVTGLVVTGILLNVFMMRTGNRLDRK